MSDERIQVVMVAGLPPEVMDAVLRAEAKLNAQLEELLTPEGLARIRATEVEFDLDMLLGKDRPR